MVQVPRSCTWRKEVANKGVSDSWLGTYAPVINTGVSNDTIFIADDPAMPGALSFCNSTYGVSPMTADQLAERYHMSQDYYEKSERIIFSVGQYDPTTALAPPSIPITANRNASKILYVSNMAHREELFAPDPRDKSEVIQVRNRVLQRSILNCLT